MKLKAHEHHLGAEKANETGHCGKYISENTKKHAEVQESVCALTEQTWGQHQL